MTVVGVRPWLPGSLGRWAWLNDPVRAERLAALRITVAITLLVDVIATYVPYLSDYYGSGSLASPDVFADRFQSPHWNWSLLRWLPETWGPTVLVWVWVVAGLALLAGWRPRLAAAIAWALSLSFYNSNYYLHNSGDRLRHTLLFFLMISPCGAVWTISPRFRTSRNALLEDSKGGERWIYPWPIRLLFVQIALTYFFNGVYKLLGSEWRDGTIMDYILHDVGWSRWSLPLPLWLEQGSAWFVMSWELGFPLLVLIPMLRVPTLVIGVLFHIVSGLQLELGMFPLYALCFYVPLIAWERWSRPTAPCSRPGDPTQ